MGFKYASLEVALDALMRAGSLDRAKIRDAIAATDTETMIGPVKFNAEHYSLISLTGGQWVMENGKLKLNIVDNSFLPSVPLTGDLIKLR
jgi:branched-chain amino acid transport system substrate-binding protein